ncbi:MAG: ABC transporter ATP-binding protein [Chloroflexi bacterium]|nr:ABC transporter ATP-binding protein [Chloroflexota bacterium]
MPEQLLVERVCKSFDGLRALDNVSLTLSQGEILGLIGPNGSGKTTLINVISGLIPITSGKIWACGDEITNHTAYRIARNGIARTFQTIRLFRELTVQENVEVAALGVGVSRSAARQRAARALAEMNLESYAEMRAGTLPYGLERRLEVARALAMAPIFILLDEPGAGLNEEESDDLLDILERIRERHNVGMLVVEHDMRLIMRLCDRLHVLDSGRTIASGTPVEIRENARVIEAYLGRSKRVTDSAAG